MNTKTTFAKNDRSRVFRGLEHLKGVHAQYCNFNRVLVAAAPRRKPRAEHGVITRGVDHIHGALRTSSRSSSSKRVRMASTTRESTTTHSRASSAKTSWRG